jgi:Na+-translocating ferredoxin:NAD+ oxidoreductase subunit C
VLCQNVATAAAIWRAVDRGETLTSRIVTVTGRGVRSPGNLDVRLGTPLAHLISECGGYTEEAERLILGGPMMGYAVATDRVPAVKATNGILVAGAGELAVPREVLPCVRCGACAEVCPAQLLPQQLHWHARSRQLGRALDQHLLDCIECGCCDVVCPSHIPLVREFQAAKREVQAQEATRAKAEQARRRFEARQARLDEEQHDRERVAAQRKAGLQQGASAKIQEALARTQQKRKGPMAIPTQPELDAGPAAGEALGDAR